jgi:hypothetical protein
LLAQILAMSCLVIHRKEFWVDLIKRRGGVLALAQDCTAIDIMEKYVEFMQLVRITAVVVKNILTLLATQPVGDSNQFGACIGGSKDWGFLIIWR